MSATTYLKNKVRDHLNGVAAFTVPATVYWALHTGAPGATGASNQATGTGYARVAMTNNGTKWTTSASGSASNKADIQFPGVGATPWGTITHVSKWDAATNGNCLEYATLAAPVATSANTTGPLFAIGDMVETVA